MWVREEESYGWCLVWIGEEISKVKIGVGERDDYDGIC